GPCELIDGRIVPMTPPGGEHGRIEISLGRCCFILLNSTTWGGSLAARQGYTSSATPIPSEAWISPFSRSNASRMGRRRDTSG
ncbi:MAG: hypothetical protein HC884_19805, partial [Chloroflexaceae bacterium]|nr:hypothetical protein [Chloroflexaceae bacterium]